MIVTDLKDSPLGHCVGMLFDEDELRIWRAANPDAVIVGEQQLTLVIQLVEGEP